MKLKRLLSFVLAVCLIASLAQFPVMAAENEMVLAVSSKTATPGDTVEVTVDVSNNPGLASLKFAVDYDDTVLTLTNIEFNSAFGSMITAPEPYTSPQDITMISPLVDVDANGVFATLTFKVAVNAPDSHKAEINIVYDTNDIFDGDYNPVDISVVNGEVNIFHGIPGDINADRSVNTKDAVALFRYVAGWTVDVDYNAIDTNGDLKVNTKDAVALFRYVAGWPDIKLYYGTLTHTHTIEYHEAKAATCTDEGNNAYYYCTSCNRYFNDEEAKEEIDYKDVIIEKVPHNEVEIPAVPPTYTSTGLTSGIKCEDCGEIIVSQTEVPMLEKNEFSITYEIATGESKKYIAAQNLDAAISNEYRKYNKGEGLKELPDLELEGFQFLGWYTEAPENSNAVQVTEIPTTAESNIKLYAHWHEYTYDVTYNLYQTPAGVVATEEQLHYTVSKGLQNLPNPEIYNYIFLGWYLEDGTEITEIPVGTTEDITLHAYWTSKRNLAKAVSSLEAPIILENTEDGVIYFAYEIGTIENIPLSEPIWTLQGVSGLAQKKSETRTTSTTETVAKTIAETISKTTVDSATWTLSNDWSEVVEVNEQWAEENGMTQEEALEKTKTSSGTISITDSNGGAETDTTTDGTTTVTYDSKNSIKGNSAEFNVKVSGSYSNEGNLSSKIAGTFKVSGEVGAGYEQHQETNAHTGTDTTKVDTTVNASSSTWNHSATSSSTESASASESVSKALSQIISNTKGYGQSYVSGGEDSSTQGLSSTDSSSVNSSSTVTYSKATTDTTTTEYSTDGKSEGWYRMVTAGKAHVFAVVGYDVASGSYFTYTFTVMDDKTYDFLDYSPSSSFDDCEYSVIPFEIPYDVYEYVSYRTLYTEGLSFTTNSKTGTATVVNYTGSEKDITIPDYVTSGGRSYKVTAISATAFAGKDIEAVILSNYIDEIPAGAFKNCTSLKQIIGGFTVIGDEAFSGCTSLEGITISERTTKIGTEAFKDVTSIKFNALDAEIAKSKTTSTADAVALTQTVVNEALASGAKNITLDLSSTIDGVIFTIEVGAIDSFELIGGKKNIYTDLRLKSSAKTTTLKDLTIIDTTRVPLEISSDTLVLDVVDVESQSYALLFSGNEPTLKLYRDSYLESASGEAVVTKTPTIVSLVEQAAVGILYIDGNTYINGTDEMNNQFINSSFVSIANGTVKVLSNDEYSQYIKGKYTLTFDANGGAVSETSKSLFCGSSVGTLPTPTKSGHSFDGWFTAEDKQVASNEVLPATGDVTLYAKWTLVTYSATWEAGTGYSIAVTRTSSPLANASIGAITSGTKVYYGDVLTVSYNKQDYYTITGHGETEITVSGDVTTSDIYASVKFNDLSDWVLASSIPSGATTIENKWTYTRTQNTESTDTSMSGWTQVGNYWRQTGTGSQQYATFPSGYSTSDKYYTSMAKEPYSAYENTTTKREVSNNWAGYIYWHWMYDTDYANTVTRTIADCYGNGVSNGWWYGYFYAIASTVNCPFLDNEYVDRWKPGYAPNCYNCASIIPSNNRPKGTPRMMRFDYYTSTYTDFQKVFQYQKVTKNVESATQVNNGGEISNVQHYVRYRMK